MFITIKIKCADREVLGQEPFAEVKSQTQNELFSVSFSAIQITVYHTSDLKSMIYDHSEGRENEVISPESRGWKVKPDFSAKARPIHKG
jgi:hypothetical protein